MSVIGGNCMFCKYCGTKNDEGSHYCMECGKPMDERPVVFERSTAPQVQPVEEIKPPIQINEPVTVKEPEEKASYLDKVFACDVSEDAKMKLPFSSRILKIARIGIWTLLVLSVFFCWFFIKVSYFDETTKETMNIFKVILGGCDSAFLSFVAVLTLITILAAAGIQIFNTFGPKKIKLPEFILCAAPAAMSLLYIVCAWIASIAILGEYRGSDVVSGVDFAGGPGFGAWFVLILSLIETAAWFLFIKDKNEKLIKF